jgi:Uncharacterized protein with conserved CXXC pairs
MICGECGKNEAVFHYKANHNGVVTEKHLCAQCADKSGLMSQGLLGAGMFSGLANGMLGELLGGMIGNTGSGTVIKEAAVCPFCGMRIDELMQNGKAGCAKCYKTFRGALSPTIHKIHGNTEHTGKVPEGSHQYIKEQSKLADLKKGLQEAIDKQEYEEAAKIRDEIRAMENERGNAS